MSKQMTESEGLSLKRNKNSFSTGYKLILPKEYLDWGKETSSELESKKKQAPLLLLITTHPIPHSVPTASEFKEDARRSESRD